MDARIKNQITFHLKVDLNRLLIQRIMNHANPIHQSQCHSILQIVAARGAVVVDNSGDELEVRVGADRVCEGAGEEGEAQRRARAQEEGRGEHESKQIITECTMDYGCRWRRAIC